MRINDDINIKDFFSSIVSELKPYWQISDFNNGLVTTSKTSGFKYQGQILESADLKDGDYVDINDKEYVVSDVTANSFRINETDIGMANSWEKARPYFLYNHPQEANSTWTFDLGADNLMKLPFIGVFTPFNISDSWDNSEIQASTFTPWLVFMDDVNFEQFTFEEHQTVISNMTKIYRDFIYILKCNKYVVNRDTLTCTRVNYQNWGLVARTRGTEAQLFNGHLSGVEITDLEIQLKKTYDNCN